MTILVVTLSKPYLAIFERRLLVMLALAEGTQPRAGEARVLSTVGVRGSDRNPPGTL